MEASTYGRNSMCGRAPQVNPKELHAQGQLCCSVISDSLGPLVCSPMDLNWWLHGPVLERLWGDTTHPRAKKSQEDGRVAKSSLASNPIPARGPQRTQTNPCAHQDPKAPQRLRQHVVWVSPVEARVSSGRLQGRGLGAVDLDMA